MKIIHNIRAKLKRDHFERAKAKCRYISDTMIRQCKITGRECKLENCLRKQ
jgi:hypothetical protein